MSDQPTPRLEPLRRSSTGADRNGLASLAACRLSSWLFRNVKPMLDRPVGGGRPRGVRLTWSGWIRKGGGKSWLLPAHRLRQRSWAPQPSGGTSGREMGPFTPRLAAISREVETGYGRRDGKTGDPRAARPGPPIFASRGQLRSAGRQGIKAGRLNRRGGHQKRNDGRGGEETAAGSNRRCKGPLRGRKRCQAAFFFVGWAMMMPTVKCVMVGSPFRYSLPKWRRSSANSRSRSS